MVLCSLCVLILLCGIVHDHTLKISYLYHNNYNISHCMNFLKQITIEILKVKLGGQLYIFLVFLNMPKELINYS